MNIVVATKEQLSIVRDLALKIWPVTYTNVISAGQIEYMLDMMYSLESLENQLQSNKVFLLAEDDNHFLGFASYELDYKDENQKNQENLKQVQIKTRIHKLYVLPENQKKGIGKQLIDCVAEIARTKHNSALDLTVNKNNPATAFYLKNGFEITEKTVFDIGNGYVMDDYIMEKKI